MLTKGERRLVLKKPFARSAAKSMANLRRILTASGSITPKSTGKNVRPKVALRKPKRAITKGERRLELKKPFALSAAKSTANLRRILTASGNITPKSIGRNVRQRGVRQKAKRAITKAVKQPARKRRFVRIAARNTAN